MEENRISYPPPKDSGPGSMCPRHNLRRGPMGECVICKREREQREAERKKRGRFIVPTISIVGLLGAAAVIAFNVVSNQKPASAITQSGSDETLEGEGARPANAAFEDEPERRVRPTEVNADDQQGAEEAEPEAREAKKRTRPTKEEVASARRLVSITMYYTDRCPVCRRAIAYMREEGISYTGQDIENAYAQRENKILNPKGSVPTFKIDDEVHVGFSPAGLERRIDRAAYVRAKRDL